MSALFLLIRVVEFIAVVAVIGFTIYAIINSRIGVEICQVNQKAF